MAFNFWNAVGGGIANAWGAGNDLVDQFSGATSAREANQANKEISDNQMNFQREMSNTAYQRAMADMRRAGVNPMLAITNGGASTPQGAGIPSVPVPTLAQGLGKVASTAIEVQTGMADLQNKKLDGVLKGAQTMAAAADAQYSQTSARKSAADAAIAESRLGAEKSGAELEDQRNKYEKTMGGPKIDFWTRKIKDVLGIGNSALDLTSPRYGKFNLGYSENDMLNAAKGKGVLKPRERKPLP